MQHVHHAGEAHGINRPVGVAGEVIDQFQNGTAAKSFQRFGSKALVTILNLTQGKPMRFRTLAGNRFKSLRLEPTK